MKKGITRWVSIVVAIAVAWAMLIPGCTKAPATPEKGPIAPKEYVIGGIQALSGPAYTPWILKATRGATLAVAEINEAGGIDGIPMKMVWEDHKAKGPDAVSCFNKLIDIDSVPTSTIGFTAPVMACAPVADEREILLINHGAHGPAIAGCGKYVFHTMLNQITSARVALYHAAKELGWKTLGIVYVNDTMGISMKDFLTEYCPKIGVTIVGTTAFDVATTDFSAQIAKAKGWGADAIYASMHSSHYPLIKQSHEVGWDPQWIGMDPPVYAIFLHEAGPGVEGMIGAQAEATLGAWVTTHSTSS